MDCDATGASCVREWLYEEMQSLENPRTNFGSLYSVDELSCDDDIGLAIVTMGMFVSVATVDVDPSVGMRTFFVAIGVVSSTVGKTSDEGVRSEARVPRESIMESLAHKLKDRGSGDNGSSLFFSVIVTTILLKSRGVMCF